MNVPLMGLMGLLIGAVLGAMVGRFHSGPPTFGSWGRDMAIGAAVVGAVGAFAAFILGLIAAVVIALVTGVAP